jgi:putative NADH-flavin reductase
VELTGDVTGAGPLRLTVFGASGRIGKELVGQARQAGHQVTAVVRDASALSFRTEGVRLAVTPDLDDPGSLDDAVAGADAVVSALGPRRRSDAGVASRLTALVLAAMSRSGTTRLVVVSAAPLAPTPPDEPLLGRWVMMPLVRAILRANYADLREMEAAIARSATSWTVVRPPRLVDSPLTGRYRTAIDSNPPGARRIGRADVAHAMLAAMRDPALVDHVLGLAY